ncbi:MAG: c-type cytochrome [Planctomycetota bacterium]|nr:c-type cytochrome [Planctomycetota bacterium]
MYKAFAVVVVSLALPTLAAVGQGFTPDEAVQRMKVPDGFDVQLVASEPLVRQPVCIEFDDRGRLWVIQYLQYPNPAELKRVEVDRYSRTQYDRIPKPPPHGPRGADRITILEDSDGDGQMDRGRDFVDGLNLASGIAFGHGGVFVLNVPYLLFYPDKDRDDIPDSDPEVLLTGFGMDDAHSVANSLTWGPDGWLYGCQGSTVTANVRGIEFQQGVWRYHPLTREFELFCEGGGNSWGLDFDRVGNLLYSTNYGGFVLLHGVQGGYFVKSFAKHGALHNPHAYGYFNHAPHNNFLGGHVTVGGIVYQGDSFPPSFRGKYIAADLLGHGVYWHDVEPHGSTFRTAHGGELLVANDTWFAPTDVTMGPDGAIYVSDWHDPRTAHPDPDADWDRSNGRIYRIAATGTKPAKPIDFAKLSADALLDLQEHRSQWYVRRARQELARRRDSSAAMRLRKTSLNESDEAAALEALWSLNAIGGFDESVAMKLLDSPHPAVRAWTVRLIGGAKREVSEQLAHRLDEFAEQELAAAVRQQLACTAARLPAHQALPIINANINRDIDNDDPYLPLLWWWAVERHSVSGRDEVMRRFVRPSLWKSRLGRDTLLTRLIRRYMAEGTSEGLDSVAQLVKAAPDDSARDTLWSPILQGWREVPRGDSRDAWKELSRNHELSRLVLQRWQAKPDDLTLQQLGIALGNQEPLNVAMHDVANPESDVARRVAILEIFADGLDGVPLGAFYPLVNSDAPEPVRIAALKVVGLATDWRLAAAMIELHRESDSEALKSQIREVLLSRQNSALAWLNAVDRGKVPASSTPLEQIRRVTFFDDPKIDSLVTKHWGKLQAASRGERLAEVRRLNNDLRAAGGNTSVGKGLFKTHCASCHQLFGEGTKLGPDLTTANRADLDYLLISLVDPSSVIRKEYVDLIVQTTDGRVLTGLPVARDDAGLTLVNAKNERINIAAGEIDQLHESPVSMMPDDLYRKLKPQELRDLFAYLQSTDR